MADENDLERLHAGEIDLAQSDFRDANLSGLNLSGRDFTGAHLDRVKAHGTNFTGCNFTGSQMIDFDAAGADLSNAYAGQLISINCIFSSCSFRQAQLSAAYFTRVKFDGADLSGSNFEGAHFNEGTSFVDAISDDESRFDGAVVFRPISRSDVFRNYVLERGRLVRRAIDSLVLQPAVVVEGTPDLDRQEPIPSRQDRSANRQIEARISTSPREIADLAGALSLAIDEQLGELTRSKPNDAYSLALYEDYVAFLGRLSGGLAAVQEAIFRVDIASKNSGDERKFAGAAEVVTSLGAEAASWIHEHRKNVVDLGFKTGLLGACTAFLVFCGVPALLGFGTVAAVLSGQSVIDGIASTRDRGK